jgi:hypothetical protein
MTALTADSGANSYNHIQTAPEKTLDIHRALGGDAPPRRNRRSSGCGCPLPANKILSFL